MLEPSSCCTCMMHILKLMFCVDAKFCGPVRFSAWAPIHTRASAVPTQVSGLQCIPGSVLQLRFVLLAASPTGGCLGSISYPGQCCPRLSGHL